MLSKDVFGIISDGTPAFSNRLFIVEEAFSSCKLVLVSSRNSYVTLSTRRWRQWLWFWSSLEKGMFCFQRIWKVSCFWIILSSPWKEQSSIKTIWINLWTVSQFFTRVFTLDLTWVCQQVICLLPEVDDWLVIVDSVPQLLEHCCLLFQPCKDLEIIISRAKLDWESKHRTQYLRLLIDTIQNRLYQLDSQIVWFWESSKVAITCHSASETVAVMLIRMAQGVLRWFSQNETVEEEWLSFVYCRL